jgi:ATP-dependent DNA helicase RecG
VVIRELIANALIHQDFLMGGVSVMIEIYSDRVEISSPGEPLVSVERFIDGYQSRNERQPVGLKIRASVVRSGPGH